MDTVLHVLYLNYMYVHVDVHVVTCLVTDDSSEDFDVTREFFTNSGATSVVAITLRFGVSLRVGTNKWKLKRYTCTCTHVLNYEHIHVHVHVCI